MLAVAAQAAFAGTLLGEAPGKLEVCDDWAVEWGELLQDREEPAGWTISSHKRVCFGSHVMYSAFHFSFNVMHVRGCVLVH